MRASCFLLALVGAAATTCGDGGVYVISSASQMTCGSMVVLVPGSFTSTGGYPAEAQPGEGGLPELQQYCPDEGGYGEPCTEIFGYLMINATDLTSLVGLESLTQARGLAIINNEHLTPEYGGQCSASGQTLEMLGLA